MKIGLGVAVAFFFLLIFAGLQPSKPRYQQIEEGCRREFASEGEERIQRCQLQIMTREMDAAEGQKMERASR